MKLLVVCDAHIYKTPDNKYWSKAIYSNEFWERYLTIFDNLRIAARVKSVEYVDNSFKRVDSNYIEIFDIYFFQGPKNLIKNYFTIKESLRGVFDACDAVIYRLPSPIGQLIYREMNDKGIPFSIEVVFDLTDDINDKSHSFIYRTISKIQSEFLKKVCLKANGVSYVTEYTIQRNYPSRARILGESNEFFESYYSTITLSRSYFTGPRDYTMNKEFTFVMSDVAMNGYRKGEKNFINIIKNLRDKGYNVNGIIIGDGAKKKEFKKLAKSLDISDHILFTGLLSSSKDVREYLLKSDIVVFPSEAEGLPRCIIEGMAVGLPVISSPVGGIPEIINENYLISPNDIKSYVSVIETLLNDVQLMNQISKQNYEKSKEFCNDVLQLKRNKFYKQLRDLCEK